MATRIRQKAEKREQNKDLRPYAIVKHVRMSPSKVRIVLDNIRGKKVSEAVSILTYAKEYASEPILKVLNSAIANAENNKGLNKDNLFVSETFVTAGPTLKRIDIRAKGRANTLLKRTCHITVVLDEVK